MTFDNILDQAIEMLQRRGRVTYRTLKRQFHLDAETLEDLTFELIEGQRIATDENGTVLVWIGEAAGPSASITQPKQTTQLPEQQEHVAQVEPPSPKSHIPEAERRQLTILFTDLVDSTKLSGQLDAEDYREIVRAYQATCAEVIERFDCHLAQTLGDGLLIYSGYPVAHDNDAERAMRVGLGILDTMKTLNERLQREEGIRLAVRVGIHTGSVVIGEVGAGARQEQLALGEVPNIAARIQGLAEPDTVVISEATYRLIQGYFDCDALGEQILRGVAESVTVYRVLQESGFRSRLDIASARGLTPLVGREQETGLLIERWRQVKEGQGQVIFLSGEAGIGKSRLVQVLKDHVADASHIRLECRSSPYFTNSALYPIIDMLQRTLRFQVDDTAEQKLEKLEHNLSQYRLPLDESVPLFAALLSLSVPENRYPPLSLAPQRQRQKTLASIVSIIQELAERQPVLFILEDAHWQDPSTHELLVLLIDQTPTTHLLILITSRPEFQPTWGNRSYLTHLTLNRLARNQIARMAEQVAGGKRLPDAIVQQLVDKTDGVPLFVEELTKSVLESGHLKEMDDHYELVDAASPLTIPSTLQDSLMARLDRLVTAKVVAQYAAVIGRQFSYDLLQAVSQLDEPTLHRELRRLVEAELVYQRGVLPAATYIFKHALIQDMAYESLLHRTRQQYHQRIAHTLEMQFPERVEARPELVAYHYTEAGLAEQAVVYWQRAGEHAVKHSAYTEAIAHLSKGLQVLTTLPESRARAQQELGLRLTLGPALASVQGAGFEEIMHGYRRAAELCQQVGDQRQFATILTGQRRFYLMRRELHSSREVAEELLRVAQQLDDLSLRLHDHHELANSLIWMGDHTKTQAQLDQAIALYDQSSPHSLASIYAEGDTLVLCLAQRALVLWLMGFPDQAFHTSQSALGQLHKVGHAYNQVVIVNWRSYLHHYYRDATAVQTQAEAALALALEHGVGHRAIQARMMQGWAWCVQGAIEEGLIEIQGGLAAWRASESMSLLTYFLTLLAEAYQQAGRVAEGLDVLQEALDQSQTSGECFWQPEIHRLEGELRLRQTTSETSQAEHCFHQAIAIARRQHAKSLELRAATSLARLWQSQDKRQEAYNLLAPVYEWFTEGFDTADLRDAKALLDKLS